MIFDKLLGSNGENSSDLLFHYTKLNTCIENILFSGSLRFSSIEMVNDPKESDFTFLLKNNNTDEDSERILFLFDCFLKRTKILCFSIDDQNGINKADGINPMRGKAFNHPRMWAQYADNHKGVCLVIDKDLLIKSIIKKNKNIIIHDKVIYSEKYLERLENEENPYSVDYQELEKYGVEQYYIKHVVKNKRIYYFRKHFDWKDEKEYRVIIINDDNKERYVSIRNCIKAVILGSRTPIVYNNTVVNLCDSIGASVFQMKWNHGFASFPDCIKENN